MKLMYEDIEVMRRLMSRNLQTFANNCQSCHVGQIRTAAVPLNTGGTASAFFTDFDRDGYPDYYYVASDHATAAKAPAVEGVYLKGHGVVFDVTLPPVVHLTSNVATTVSQKLMSEWDRTRLQLRGEKPPETKSAAQPPSLTQLLLKMLADNGQHFGQMSKVESITLVVTFRKEQPPSEQANTGSGNGRGRPGTPPVGMFAPGGGPPPGAGPMMPGSGSSTGEPGTGPPASGKDYELLADLHRKRGNWKEAVKVYEDEFKKHPTNQDRELITKLASAYLELGRVAEARKLLELYQYAANAPAAIPPKPTGTDGTPYKLIVSASKNALDQVGTGKMTFEEFVKTVSIETVTK